MERLRVFTILGLMSIVAGCQRNDSGISRPDLSNRKARVVATTGMIADAAREIAGDHIELECLLGPGGDPHKYYPAYSDNAKLAKADLILYNGLELEAKMGEIFEERAKKVRTVAVGNAIPTELLRRPEPGFEGTHDPHIWFDVMLWSKAVEKVRDALIELDPAHTDTFGANATKYLDKLKALDAEVRELALKIPADKRVIITAHDAFGYFGRAYGFEVKGLQGTSTATQTGTQSVQELAKLIGSRQIPVIFGETSVPDEGIIAVLEAVNSQYPNHRVKLSDARLYSDALGDPGTEGGTYVGMVRHNIRTVVNALAP